MKTVGDALKEARSTLGSKKIVLLGITNWTTVLNNHQLIKKPENKYAKYSRFADGERNEKRKNLQ